MSHLAEYTYAMDLSQWPIWSIWAAGAMRCQPTCRRTFPDVQPHRRAASVNRESMGQVSRQTAVLARSLVAFAFAGLVSLACRMDSAAKSRPASPAQPNETIRRILVISVGLAAALALACCVWMYRQSETSKGRLARRIAAAVRSGRLALILCIVLIECDILAIQLLRGIAPAITDPLILLLVCWTRRFRRPDC